MVKTCECCGHPLPEIEAMVKAIKEGVKDGDKTRMKPFGEELKDDEIKGLVAYFRSLKK